MDIVPNHKEVTVRGIILAIFLQILCEYILRCLDERGRIMQVVLGV